MKSAVPLHGNLLSDTSLAAMRRWLLEVDFMGYLPQLVAAEPESRLWTYFWFGIRRIDDLIDEHGFHILDDEGAFDEDLDAIVALREFMAAAPSIIDGRRRVIEQIRSFSAEREYLALGRPLTVRELFSLWYLKAYPGAYMVQRVQLSDVDEASVRHIVKLAAVGLQMFDDLADLQEDLDIGRFWLTAEELDVLGLATTPPAALPATAGERITRLRKAICLEYFLAVHDAGSRLPSSASRRLATSFAEAWLRFVQQGALKIYAPGEPKPWDSMQRLLQLLPGSETAKVPVLRSVYSLVSSLPLPAVDLAACRRELQQLGGCPKALSPEVALEVIGECEARGDRESFEAPGPSATALERRLLAARPRSTAADFARSCHESAEGSPSNLRDPPLSSVLASSLRLAARTARNSVLARDEFLRKLRSGPRRAPMIDPELAERLARDRADWLALGIEAVAATARGLRGRNRQG
jgi:hypothetical protein